MWSWDGLSLLDFARGSWCRSPRVTPGRENEERGVQAEQINHRILSASSWTLAMGTKPVPWPLDILSAEAREGKKNPLSLWEKRLQGLNVFLLLSVRQSPWRYRCGLGSSDDVSFFLADPWCLELCEHT